MEIETSQNEIPYAIFTRMELLARGTFGVPGRFDIPIDFGHTRLDSPSTFSFLLFQDGS